LSAGGLNDRVIAASHGVENINSARYVQLHSESQGNLDLNGVLLRAADFARRQ
jgi:hypothetical protein